MPAPIDPVVCRTVSRLARIAERDAAAGLDDRARERLRDAFELAGAALGVDAGRLRHALETINPGPWHEELLRSLNEGTIGLLDHELDLRTPELEL
jgi:hypothetical protein